MGFMYPVQQRTDSEPYAGFVYSRDNIQVEILHISKHSGWDGGIEIHFRLLPSNQMCRYVSSVDGVECVAYTSIGSRVDCHLTAKDLGFCMNDEECANNGDFSNCHLTVSHDVPNKTVNVGCCVGDFINDEYEVVGFDYDILVLRKHEVDSNGELMPSNNVIIVSQEHDRNMDLMKDLGIIWVGL